MGKKFYGVKYNDGRAEVFSDWNICKSAVTGEKGVSYKGFPSRDEAEAFAFDKKIKISGNDIDTRYVVYVDGSFKDDIYSYGFVLVDLNEDKSLFEKYGRGMDKEAAALRNVSGEMKGAMEAVSYCISQGITDITICYDYSGIENWATGDWKRNNEFTRMYHEYMNSKKDKIKVSFLKVKGHSGDKWNDVADMLAKKGLEAK